MMGHNPPNGQSFEVHDDEGRYVGRVSPDGVRWEARADAYTIVGTYDGPAQAARALRDHAARRPRRGFRRLSAFEMRGARPGEGRND